MREIKSYIFNLKCTITKIKSLDISKFINIQKVFPSKRMWFSGLMMNTFHDDREVLGFGPSIKFLLLYISELFLLGPQTLFTLGN